MSVPTVLVIGTCDTKLLELLRLRSYIARHDVTVKLMDVGRDQISHPCINFSHDDLLFQLPSQTDIKLLERGDVIKLMASAASVCVSGLQSKRAIHGVICIGGSGGTSLGASVMRQTLPVGFPKLIVSTVASGNVRNFIEETDITMMPSIVDIAGQNSILDTILENAAGMIAGAAKVYCERMHRMNTADDTETGKKKAIAVTMFGVTTPAVDTAREELEKHGHEVFVFHATGIGGKAMEKLIAQHKFDGVLDLTTSELADELVGGIMSAGPDRLTAASKLGTPQVVSLGGLEIVNFGPRASVPVDFHDRLLYEHNPDVTLVRTSIEECAELGRRISNRLKTYAVRPDKVRVFIPQGGFSMISTKGGPYHDEVADQILVESLEEGIANSGIAVIRDRRAINDTGLAVDMAKALVELIS